ncbi:hypothetical protein [Swingsia samuiensis]|uniref:Lipoprotein n=1 Tax=Swingsia samuiensis TaxID=1293412 RepID=A0A4Y6UJQ3_9PROT|nr:hypothetical protein [Swingsia samuiensis]QDH17792.1 hypothetical protein E3D00_09595 [Swingsia samuiensis]
MRLHFLRISGIILSAVTLSGCGYFDSRNAHRAQIEMIGMTSYDLQACAGIPGSVKKLNNTTEIWQYSASKTLTTLSGDSGFFPVQSFVNIYQSALGGGGNSCHMILRLDHDRVSEIHYAGNDDEYIGTDGICSLITRGCGRQRESTMHRVNAGPFGPVSAFHSPAIAPQSSSATYSEQSGKYVPKFSDDKTVPLIQPAK